MNKSGFDWIKKLQKISKKAQLWRKRRGDWLKAREDMTKYERLLGKSLGC